MSLKSFSQNAIDSTSIQLTKPVAKLVIKDLLKGDGALVELSTIQELLASTNDKLETQSILVVNLKEQITNYESILVTKDNQLVTAQQLSKDLEEALRKERRLGKLYKLGSTVGLGAIVLLVLK
tara:strand:+ start:1304 stop:1675 length:372 start_codon:yes stop_codon:yes gene_type:complete